MEFAEQLPGKLFKACIKRAYKTESAGPCLLRVVGAATDGTIETLQRLVVRLASIEALAAVREAMLLDPSQLRNTAEPYLPEKLLEAEEAPKMAPLRVRRVLRQIAMVAIRMIAMHQMHALATLQGNPLQGNPGLERHAVRIVQ